jgi:hypothetical protein
MYAEGRGVPQDFQAAVQWYRKAAEQGDADAQVNLGLMYERGAGGLPKNRTLAYALFNLAASGISSDDNPARRHRDRLAQELSLREIEAGQALTRKLGKPGNFRKALDTHSSPKIPPAPGGR